MIKTPTTPRNTSPASLTNFLQEDQMKGQKKSKGKANGSHGPKDTSTGDIAGLDLGYGYTKIVLPGDQRISFPSAVAPITPSIVDHYGPLAGDDEVNVDGIHCIVGRRAIGLSERFDNLSPVWWITPPFKAIIAMAAKTIPPQSAVMTGLPLNIYAAQNARSIVTNLIKTGLKAKHVEVMPQGVGAFYADPSLNHQGLKVAIVDIGARTTEFVAMSGGNYQTEDSRGIVLGVSDIYATAASELTPKLGRQVDAYEVERACRGEGEILHHGAPYDLKPIKEQVQRLAKDRAGDILHELVSLWGQQAPKYDRVIFCGGGAQLLFPHLKSYRTGTLLMPHAQFANATGFYAIADALFGVEYADQDNSTTAIPIDSVQPEQLVQTPAHQE